MAIDTSQILAPEFYAEHGYPYEIWAKIRQEDPVHRVDDADTPPYWALTRHEDIVAVSKNPKIFKNAPRMCMFPGGADPGGDGSGGMLVMDPPEHQAFRSLVSKRFTPNAMSRIIEQVDGYTKRTLDAVTTHGEVGQIDFVEKVAARIPIWVIAEMLGVPPEDWEKLYRWTNENVGATDPEFQAGRTENETRDAATMAMAGYFGELCEQRRREPLDDIISVLVHSKPCGEPMSMFQLLTYCMVVLQAGNETTRNAITGGLWQLIENPGELERLRGAPELVDSFVEETIRFVSPVIHFCRTPAEDVELGGKKIKAGEPLVLFFPSANRDEKVFNEPNRFDIGRNPNPHVGFGIGEHFCLGSHVARLELRTVFRHLIRRLKHVELVAPPERLAFAVVGGIKRMEIRYVLDPEDIAS